MVEKHNQTTELYCIQYSPYPQIVETNGRKVLSYFFLNVGEEESDDNDYSIFQTLLHFEVAIVTEQFQVVTNKQNKFFEIAFFSYSLNFYHKIFTPFINPTNIILTFNPE